MARSAARIYWARVTARCPSSNHPGMRRVWQGAMDDAPILGFITRWGWKIGKDRRKRLLLRGRRRSTRQPTPTFQRIHADLDGLLDMMSHEVADAADSLATEEMTSAERQRIQAALKYMRDAHAGLRAAVDAVEAPEAPEASEAP